MSEVPDCSCCCGGTSCVGRMEWTSEARPTTVRRRNAARDGSSYICSGSNRRCDARWTTRHEEMGAVNPPPSARLWPSGSVSIDTWRSSFRVRNRNVEPRLSRHRLPFLALSASSDPRATKRRRKEDDVVVSHEHFRSIREWPSKHEPRRVFSRMASQEGDRTRDTCVSSTSRPRAHLPRTTSVAHEGTRWTVPSCSRGGAARESSLPQPEAETRPGRCGCNT